MAHRVFVSDQFWIDLALIYPTRGGGKILAEEYGFDCGRVCRAAKERGIKADRTVRMEFYRESLKNGYFESMVREWVPQVGGTKYLEGVFGIPTVMITDAGHKFGVSSPQAKLVNYHKENLRVDYFRTLDPERAYWLGYIWADGCVADDKNTGRVKGVFLGCKTLDEDHIIKLRDTLGSRHAATRAFKKNKDGTIMLDKHGKPIERTSICLTSSDLAESLVELGIFVAKSFSDPSFPEWVTPELFPHFARGVFDGDGGCSQGESRYGHNRQSLYFAGSKLFIEGLLKRVLKSIFVYPVKVCPSGSIWRIAWCGLPDAQTFYEWMYPTPDVTCLPRKKLLLKQILGLSW